MNRLNHIAGIGFLTVLLAVPFLLMARPAAARNGHINVCYFGKVKRPLGVVVNVRSELASLIERGRVGTIHFSDTGRNFRGYDVCVRAQVCDNTDSHVHGGS